MKERQLFFSFLVLALIIVLMTQCSRPSCKKENPVPVIVPVPVSHEIVNWTNKSNSLITAHLIDDFFTDDLTGYVCGYGGIIYKTTDGFTSLTPLNSGTTQNLGAVHFTDANTGYAVGNAGTILKTTNAGATWTAMPAPTSTNYANIVFTDANTGYIVGGVGTLIKTTNAGASWTVLNSGVSVDLHCIFFTDANTGYIGGMYCTILKTTNAGASWSALNAGVGPGNSVTAFNGIHFTDANTGYAVSAFGYVGSTQNAVIVKTTNGGASWIQQANPAGTQYLSDVKFYDSNIGYATGGDINNNTSLVLKTTDGGATWSIQTTSTYRLTYFYIVKSGVAYAVGMNGALLKGNL